MATEYDAQGNPLPPRTTLTRFSGDAKKIQKQTEARITQGRADFQGYLDDPALSGETAERDFETISGQLRASADANYGEQVGNISRRLGGDTGSALFNALVTGAAGTARGVPASTLARLKFDERNQNKDIALSKANLMLALRGQEQSERGAAMDRVQHLEQLERIDQQFAESQRQFDVGIRADLSGTFAFPGLAAEHSAFALTGAVPKRNTRIPFNYQ